MTKRVLRKETEMMGVVLKQRRLKQGLTVYRAAKDLDEDPHTINRIERGDDVVSTALLRYIRYLRLMDSSTDIMDVWEQSMTAGSDAAGK